MKKFFSFCLMSMAAATMSAAELPFTVFPESGSVVDQISSVIFELDPESGYVEFDINTASDIYFTYNGDRQNTRCDAAEDTLEIILMEPSHPGTYELVIEPYAIAWYGEYDNDLETYTEYGENEEQLVFTYIIEGDAPVVGDLPFNVSPESGSVVEAIESVVLTLNPASGFSEFDVVSSDEDTIYFTFNGDFFCGVKVKGNESPAVTLTPTLPLLQPGEYTLVIAAGSLGWWSDDYMNYGENEEKLVFTYTIEGGQSVGGDLPFSVDPAPDSEVESLDVITLTLPFDGIYMAMEPNQEEMYFTKDGEMIPVGVTADSYDLVEWIITPAEPITAAGNYALIIPAGSMWYLTYEEEESFNDEDIILNYTVLGIPEPAAPVVYDVVPTGYNPKDGAEIDFNERDLNNIIISVEEGILPGEDAIVKVVPVGYEDEAIEAPLTKIKNMKQLMAEWTPMEYNGEYLVIIPKGSFGDADWINDPETGHANEEIILTYTLINATDRASLVEYTLEPEVTYTADLTSFTLTFPEGTQMISNAYATLDNTEARYYEYALFTDNGDNTFTIEFSNAPVEPGNYLFLVSEGLFGDKEFIDTAAQKGIANAAVELVIDFTPTGIKAVLNGTYGEAVYNLNGVKVADSTDNLPAGIYIVNGKKVTVK